MKYLIYIYIYVYIYIFNIYLGIVFGSNRLRIFWDFHCVALDADHKSIICRKSVKSVLKTWWSPLENTRGYQISRNNFTHERHEHTCWTYMLNCISAYDLRTWTYNHSPLSALVESCRLPTHRGFCFPYFLCSLHWRWLSIQYCIDCVALKLIIKEPIAIRQNFLEICHTSFCFLCNPPLGLKNCQPQHRVRPKERDMHNAGSRNETKSKMFFSMWFLIYFRTTCWFHLPVLAQQQKIARVAETNL